MALSYLHQPMNFSYRYESIPERFHYIAEKCGDKEVYVFLHPDGKRDSITAAELYRKARNLAYSLMKLGIKEGDKVATCMYNELDLLVSTFGVIFAGGVILNLNVNTIDGSDLKKKLNKTEVKVLILNPGESNQQFTACMNFVEKLHNNGVVDSTSVPSLQFLISTAPVKGTQLLQLHDLTEQVHAAFKLPTLDPDSIAVFFLTSGSTGNQKFVPHTHYDVMVTGYFVKESIGYSTDDVIYTERRFQWIGGFPFMLLHDGVKVVTKTETFDSITQHCDFTYKTIKRENCSIACLLPATIVGLLEKVHEMSGPSEFMLKNIHVGGLPIASVCMNAIGVISEMVTNAYGSSEVGFCTFNPIRNKDKYVEFCIGKPHGGMEVKVVDDDGFVVEREVVGTLHVRSPCMFPFYYNDEEKTKEVLSASHWMDMDDTGYITKDGKIVAMGRKSDIILQGGRNMYPSAMEAFIKSHPDVHDALVLPVEDDVLFEIACACVVPSPGKKLSSNDVDEYFSKDVISITTEAFSGGNKPGLIIIFESFPTLYTGKPDKMLLRQQIRARLQKRS